MSKVLHRRIERLAQRHALAPAGLVVVEVHESRAHDNSLLDATPTEAGIGRTDQDHAVLVKCYDADPSEPPCALLSMTARHPARRGALR